MFHVEVARGLLGSDEDRGPILEIESNFPAQFVGRLPGAKFEFVEVELEHEIRDALEFHGLFCRSAVFRLADHRRRGASSICIGGLGVLEEFNNRLVMRNDIEHLVFCPGPVVDRWSNDVLEPTMILLHVAKILGPREL